MSRLPQEVVEEDHRLEAEVQNASEALARHRWHWTMDDSNPGRVSFTDYARAVGRARTTITQYAKGWEIYRRGAPSVTITEATERANVGTEKEVATDAVAEASGRSFESVARRERDEVRVVRDEARERAEKRGTSYEEEAREVAQFRQKARETREQQQERRRDRHGMRFVEAEKLLREMRENSRRVVELCREADWDDEAVELLSHTLSDVKALIELAQTALAGSAEIDWDGELAALTNEEG